MKKILLLACALYGLKAHAQMKYIGKTENEVKIQMATTYYTYQDSTINTKGYDKVVSIEYVPNDNAPEGYIPIGFTFKNDICVRFFFHSFLKDLPNLIEYLNQKYSRVDDNNWIDSTNTYQGTLEKSDTGFYLFFKKM